MTMEAHQKLGFESNEQFHKSLDEIIKANNQPKPKAIEILNTTEFERPTENSDIFVVATRLDLPETRELKEFTLKKYKKNFENFDKEKVMFYASWEFIKPKAYSFTRERQIHLFPKPLKDILGTFNDKKIIMTETVSDSSLYSRTFGKDIIWDQLSPALDPAILLLDLLPHVIEREKKTYKNLEKLQFNDYDGPFKFLFDKCDEIDKSPKTLIQAKINPGNNNTRCLTDGSELIKGNRGFYLGSLFGHPFMYNKIPGLPETVYKGYFWRRNTFRETDMLNLENIEMPYEIFEKGFNLGAIYSNLNRKETLKQLEQSCNEKQKPGLIYELESLKETLKTQIDFIQSLKVDVSNEIKV
jgi:hypothetical protein